MKNLNTGQGDYKMDFSKIKLLVYDCDGVLTDNRVIVDECGKESVCFHRGDGLGIQKIRELGIEQLILSTEQNPVVKCRAEKLGIPAIFGAKDKKLQLKSYCTARGISPQNVMFLGNDLNDQSVMQWVGNCGCPKDAEIEVLQISHWVSTKNGGYGVIRELYRMLQQNRGEVCTALKKG